MKNAPRESKPAMLSPPEEKRPIMSARARRRLINSALTEHPVAQETMRTYDAVLLFSRNMIQWLDGEGLSEEANLIKSVKPVILNQVTEFYVLLPSFSLANSNRSPPPTPHFPQSFWDRCKFIVFFAWVENQSVEERVTRRNWIEGFGDMKVLKLKSDHRSKFYNLSMQLERRSLKKKSGLQRDSNPWPLRYRCDALPTELWSHTLGASSIYWVHFIPCSEMMWSLYEIIHICTAVVDEIKEW